MKHSALYEKLLREHSLLLSKIPGSDKDECWEGHARIVAIALRDMWGERNDILWESPKEVANNALRQYNNESKGMADPNHLDFHKESYEHSVSAMKQSLPKLSAIVDAWQDYIKNKA